MRAARRTARSLLQSVPTHVRQQIESRDLTDEQKSFAFLLAACKAYPPAPTKRARKETVEPNVVPNLPNRRGQQREALGSSKAARLGIGASNSSHNNVNINGSASKHVVFVFRVFLADETIMNVSAHGGSPGSVGLLPQDLATPQPSVSQLC